MAAVSLRLDLDHVDRALSRVETEWPSIEAQVVAAHLGSRSPFTTVQRCNMLSGYAYLNDLLDENIELFSDLGMEHMLLLHQRVHFGLDTTLITQFGSAIESTTDRFNERIEHVANRYWEQRRRGVHPLVIAADAYVNIVGQPQLFIEGNHRTAALIGSWIGLRSDCAPFVLSVDNAVPYFAASSQVKQFADGTTWLGRVKMNRYRAAFGVFWATYVDPLFCRLP
jgi:hypothetical protein